MINQSIFLQLLGIFGGFCFAYCGVPTAWATVKAGKSLGTPLSVAWMIFLGALTMFTYLYLRYGFNWILTLNYVIEAISWGVVVFYHYKSDSSTAT